MLYKLAKPLLFGMDPERAHNFTISALKTLPVAGQSLADDLAVDVAGIRFPNPIGLAAGYDKNAEVVAPLLKLGFGFVEAGTVTPKPQPGNPKPRLFRLVEDEAVINRFGFNNVGHAQFLANVQKARKKAPTGVIGGNVGANKDQTDQAADYVAGIKAIGPSVDYITINISSPNTSGLRNLQTKDHLKPLLDRTTAARREVEDSTSKRLPLFLKLAPDMTNDQLKEAIDLIVDAGIDALILTNTTLERPDTLISQHKGEMGGLSGAPLQVFSREILRQAVDHLKKELPIISVGGIDSGEEAAARLAMGACLVQVYSVLVYKGPYILRDWLTTMRLAKQG